MLCAVLLPPAPSAHPESPAGTRRKALTYRISHLTVLHYRDNRLDRIRRRAAFPVEIAPTPEDFREVARQDTIAVVRSEDAPWRDATWGETKRIAGAHAGLPAPGAPCGQASDGTVAQAVSFTRARGRRVTRSLPFARDRVAIVKTHAVIVVSCMGIVATRGESDYDVALGVARAARSARRGTLVDGTVAGSTGMTQRDVHARAGLVHGAEMVEHMMLKLFAVAEATVHTEVNLVRAVRPVVQERARSIRIA